MDAQTIQAILRNHQNELQALGVEKLHLFGSASRGETTPTSDLDFLVELKVYSFQNFMDLKFALETWFGKSVDLGTFQQLKPLVRQAIAKDLLRVA
jgi:predicted nucleotidyltransferase